MNIKAFFVDALTSALDMKIGTPEDVLRHVTPDVLALHLPRPLWARLLRACLGASRVDAQLVVETVGIPNLCEHIPAAFIWGCIADLAAGALGKQRDAAIPAAAIRLTQSGRAMLAPPPDINNAPTATGAPVSHGAIGPSIPPAAPLQDLITELEESDDPRGSNNNAMRSARSPTAQRFRQSSTGVARGGLGANARRPQAVAPPAPTTLPRPSSSSGRRGGTEQSEPEPPTSVETADWGAKEIAVDDSQLVDWQTDLGSPSAITGDDDFSDLGGRKR